MKIHTNDNFLFRGILLPRSTTPLCDIFTYPESRDENRFVILIQF